MTLQSLTKISLIVSLFVIWTFLISLNLTFVASTNEINSLIYYNLASAVPALPDSPEITCSQNETIYQATFSGRVSCKNTKAPCNEGIWKFQWRTEDAEKIAKDTDIDWIKLEPSFVSFYFYDWVSGTIAYRRNQKVPRSKDSTMTTVEFFFPAEGEIIDEFSPPAPLIVGEFGFYGNLFYCFQKVGRYNTIHIPTTLNTTLNTLSTDSETAQLSQVSTFYQYHSPYISDAALSTISTYEADKAYSYSDVNWYLIGSQLIHSPQDVIVMNMTLIGAVEFIVRRKALKTTRCDPEDAIPVPESEKFIPVECFLNSNRFIACLHPNRHQVTFKFDNTITTSHNQTFDDLASKTFYENSYIQFDCSAIGISAQLSAAQHKQTVYLQLEYVTANSTKTFYQNKPQPFLLGFDPFFTTQVYPPLPTFPIIGSTEQKLFNRHFISQPNKYPNSVDLQDEQVRVYDSNTRPTMAGASTFSTDGIISCRWTLNYPSPLKADGFFHSAHIEFTGLVYFTDKANETSVSIHTRVNDTQVTPIKQTPVTETTPITGYEHKLGPSLTQNVPIYSMNSGFRAGVYLATATTFDFDIDLLRFDKNLEKDDPPKSVDIIAFIPFVPGGQTGQPVQCSLVITKEMCSNAASDEYDECVRKFNDIYITPPLDTSNQAQPSVMRSQTITTTQDHTGLINRKHKAIPLRNPFSKKKMIQQKSFRPISPANQLPQTQQAEIKSSRLLVSNAAQTSPSKLVDTPANAFVFVQNQSFFNATSIVLKHDNYDIAMKYFRMDIDFLSEAPKTTSEYFEEITFQFPMRYWEFVELPRHDPLNETSIYLDPEPLCRYYHNKTYSDEIPIKNVIVTMETHKISFYGWGSIQIIWPLRIQCERIIFVRVKTETVNCNFSPGSENCYFPWQSKFTKRTAPGGWKSPEKREVPPQDKLPKQTGLTQKRSSHLYHSRSRALPITNSFTKSTTANRISTDFIPDSSMVNYAQLKWCLVSIVESLIEISATAVNYFLGDEYQTLPLQFPWRNEKGELFEFDSLNNFTTSAIESFTSSSPSIATFSHFIHDLYSTLALLFVDEYQFPRAEIQSSLPNSIEIIDYSTLSSIESFVTKPSSHKLSHFESINLQSSTGANDEIELIEYFNAEKGHYITNLPHHQQLQSLNFGKNKLLQYNREQLKQSFDTSKSKSPSVAQTSFPNTSSLLQNSLSTPLNHPVNSFHQFYTSQYYNDEDDTDDYYSWFNLTDYLRASNRNSEKTIISAEFKMPQHPNPTLRFPAIRVSGNFFKLWAQNLPHPISRLVIYLLIVAGAVVVILIAVLLFHKFEILSRCATRAAKMTQKRPKKPLTEQEVDDIYMEEYPIGYSCEELY